MVDGGKWFRIGILAVACLFLTRVHLVAVRLFDPDELEHAHVSLQMSRGQLPYRDFFEHHGPLPYFAAATVPHVFGESIDLLIANRLLSLGFSAVVLWTVYSMARSYRGPNAGLLGCLWLETMPWFLEKSIEWRPDVPATCFLVLAARRMLTTKLTPRGAVVAGFQFGLATLCTPKVAIPILIIAGGFIAGQMAKKRNPIVLTLLGIAGGIVAWLPFFAWFALHGALKQFVDCVLVLPATWQTHRKFVDVFRMFPNWAPGHLALLAWSAWSVLRGHWRPSQWLEGPTVLAMAAIVQFALVPWAPAAYLQYYLIVLPFGAVTVGVAIRDLATAIQRADRSLPRMLEFAFFVGGVATLIFVQSQSTFIDGKPADAPSLVDPWRPRSALAMLPKVTAHNPPWSKIWYLAVFATFDLACVAVAALCLMALLAKPRWACVPLAIALAAPGLARVANTHFFWRKDEQMADFAAVRKIVGIKGTVLDGFTGIAWQNPHAFYWWWINQHNAWLIEKRGDLGKLAEVVSSGQPDAIIFDKVWNNDTRMRAVYDAVIVPLGQRYRPTKFQPQSAWCMLFLRNDLPDPSAADSN